MATICPDRAELSEFALGRLDERRIDSVSDHLEQCDECQTTVGLIAAGDDTFVEAIREIAAADEIADEPQCQAALAQIEAIGREATPDDEPRVVDSPGRLREYQLLAQLGEGGMGTVYKALHTRLRRVVALKVLASHRRHDPSVVERFAREIEAAGKLSHPNIVTAHDAGEEDDVHYLAMELVEGVDLHTLVAEHGPLPVADACEIIRQAALGLQHAHEHGLVHRDLKPSNIMLSAEVRSRESAVSSSNPGTATLTPGPCPLTPVVKILDLGLALLQGDHVASEHITATGQVVGTLDYMAPEQADDSHGVDIRADIYSLGCTLFKLLTGRALFSGESFDTPAKKILAHAQTVPPSIREQREDVPEELAALIDNMLTKDPGARPATPADVAALLEPSCSGNDLAGLVSQVQPAPECDARIASADEIPVMLRPATSAHKHRRRTALGISVAAAALLLMVAAAGIVISIKRPGKQDTTIEPPEGSHVAISSSGHVDVTLPAQLLLPDDFESSPFSSRVDQYGDPLPLGAVARMGTERFRHGTRVDWLSFSADGNVVASCTADANRVGTRLARTRFWDIHSGKMLGQLNAPARFLFDGTTLAIMDQPIRLWDVRQGEQVATLDTPFHARLSLDGKTLVGSSRSRSMRFSFYDPSSGRERLDMGHSRPIALSPSGGLVATIGHSSAKDFQTLSIWDAVQPKMLWQQQITTNFAEPLVVFSHDGNKVAILLQQRYEDWPDDGVPSGSSIPTHTPAELGVYEARSGKRLLSLSRDNGVSSLAFAPDGRTLACAEITLVTGRGVIHTWDVIADRPIRTFKAGGLGAPHSSTSAVSSLAFSPDGRTLIAGIGSLLHVWDVPSGVKRWRDQESRQPVTMLAVSPDGKSMVTSGDGGAMQLWDLMSGRELQELGELAHPPSVAFSPDGHTLFASGEEGVHLYRRNDGRTYSTSWKPFFEDKSVTRMAVSADGRRLSVLGDQMSAWQLPEQKRLTQWLPDYGGRPTDEEQAEREYGASSYLFSPVFSPDTKKIAACEIVGGRGAASPLGDLEYLYGIRYHDVDTGQRLHTIPMPRHGRMGQVQVFTPDSRVLLWSDIRQLHFQDVQTHREALKIEWWMGLAGPCFSPDLRLLASRHRGERIRVWDFATGRKLLELAGHSGDVKPLAFSADGRFLVSGSVDTTALVWDLDLARRELEQRYGRSDISPPWDDTELPDAPDFAALWVDPPGANQADRAMWTLVAGGPRAAEFLRERLSELTKSPGHATDAAADARRDAGADHSADVRRAERAVMALERIGDGKARAVLQTLANTAAGELSETEVGRALLPVQNATGKSARATTDVKNPQTHIARVAESSETIARWSQQALDRISRRSMESASRPAEHSADTPKRVDAHGDPLPPGAIARLGAQRLRQGKSIQDVVYLADGQLLASTGNSAILLWDANTGRELQTLPGHQEPVRHLAALADGKALVSCDSRTVRYWNVDELLKRRRQDLESDRTERDAGSKSERNPANAETRASSATTRPPGIEPRCLEFSGIPEGHAIRLFAHARDGRVFVCGTADESLYEDTTTVTAFDAGTGKMLQTFDMDYRYDPETDLTDIVAVDLSPDGRLLAVAAASSIVDVWDVTTGQRAQRLKEGGESSFDDVAYSPDGKWLVTGDGTQIFWFNAQTHELERTTAGGGEYAPAAFAFSDNGAVLASRNYFPFEIRLWDVASGRLLRSIPTLQRCDAMSLSPDGANLAASTSLLLTRWNTATGEPLAIEGAHQGIVEQVVLSPDGETAATSTRFAVRLWDLPTGTLRQAIWLADDRPQEYQTYAGPVGFTADGDLVICQQEKQIGLWDRTGQFQRSLYRLDGAAVQSLACFPQQSRLAFDMPSRATHNGYGRRTVVVLDLRTGETIHEFSFEPLRGTDKLCYLPSGETLFSSALRTWDVSSGRRRSVFPLGNWSALAASSDSRVLATLTGHATLHSDAKKLRLWDLISGQVIRDIEVPTSAHRLAISPDCRIIAIASHAATVHLWDVSRGTELATLEGHRGGIRSLAFSRDGRQLATAGRDHTALVWDLTPHLRKLKPPTPVPDERMLHRAWQALAYQTPPPGEWLAPAPFATPQQQAAIESYLDRLNADDPTVVVRAENGLEDMGYLAVPAVRNALRDAKSPENRQRLEAVLAEIEAPPFIPPERLTTARTIRVLELLATDHARSVLEQLAAGAPDAPRTKQAQAALARALEYSRDTDSPQTRHSLPDDDVHISALVALGLIGTDKAKALLVEKLEKDKTPAVRQTAIQVLRSLEEEDSERKP